LLAHQSTGLDPAPVGATTLDAQAIEGLHLVAANRRALQSLRTHATEVAASARRLRISDELAAAQLSSELERMVVPRIQRAVAALGGDDSPSGDEARASLALVVDEIQGLAAGLAPAALRDGLGAALAALSDRDVVSVSCDVGGATVDPASALVLYFVATECVTNALRHGAPSFVLVDLRDVEGGDVELTVTDDGRGVTTDHAGGSGLASLRSRAEAADGTVRIRPRQGGGTVVTVRLPSRLPTTEFTPP
jgi:signal transduction histidine kinase